MKTYSTNVLVDEKDILRLLGYKGNDVNDEVLNSVREEIERAKDYLKPQIIYDVVNIKEILEEKVILENCTVLEGKYVADKLKGCSYVMMVVATVGDEPDKIIKESFESGDYLRGMIVDHIGSSSLEYLNRAFWNKAAGELQGTDMGITSGLSPGSGNREISLLEQRKIFDILKPEKIGVTLTESCLMMPLKSTSVIYGFGPGIGITRAEHVCSECNNKTCPYRRQKTVRVTVNQGSEKKFIDVPAGQNLLNVLRQNGVFIQSPCSGNKTCGKCKVLFLDGADEPTEADKNHLSEEEIKKGIRLSCAHIVSSPIEIEILSGREVMNVMTRGGDINVVIKPNAVKKYIELPLPSIEDQRSDIQRIKDGLGIQDLDVNLKLTRKIAKVLRDGNFKITASVYKNMLIDVEEGDTTGKFYGIALDIGTTTIACYLVDLHTGRIIDVVSEVNKQRSYGADVISRINYTIENVHGTETLQKSIIDQINEMSDALCRTNNKDKKDICNMTIVGNTTMLHLLLGLPSENISMSPYIPVTVDTMEMRAGDMGINIGGVVTILPSVASYVGSDITAGILACNMLDGEKYSLLLDLGTNGEIALGNKDGIITCSTAAGPAFEGANIKHGVGGIKGAISRVDLSREIIYDTIGGGKPCGICGSGVLDMVSELVKYGIVDETGRMVDEDELELSDKLKNHIAVKEGMKEFVICENSSISFTQKDVREVQLAKAAVCAGIKILLKEKGIGYEDVENIYIAGGFGNFMNIESALSIGLIPKEFKGKVKSIGNSAGTGARMYLVSGYCAEKMDDIIKNTRYIELSGRLDFQDEYVDSMMFGG